jgi:hypothetical protein
MARRTPFPSSAVSLPTFRPADAELVWRLAHEREAAGDRSSKDHEVYEYLERRGLAVARGHDLFGVLAAGMPLPEAVATWASSGYRLIAPLYDRAGRVVNVQARSIRNAHPKTLFPKGSRAAGTVFATGSGVGLLRGVHGASRHVLLAEGLTDFIALGVACPVPVLSAPGTGMALRCVGAWVHGLGLIVATDCDAAGEAVVSAVAEAAHGWGAINVRRLIWPKRCKDACEVVDRVGIDGLASFLKAKLDG